MEFYCSNGIEEQSLGILRSGQIGPSNMVDNADIQHSHEVQVGAAAEVSPHVETRAPEIHTVGDQVTNRYWTPGSQISQKPVKFVDSPDWLPKGWITEVRTRERGSSAGNKDKYFYDPVSKRRFRSKKEVFCFLETGKLGRYKPRPKIRPEGLVGLETKTSSKTEAKLPKFHSNALESAEVLPSTTPNAGVLSSSSHVLPISITSGSERFFYNKITTLPYQPTPMFGFIYQSGAVLSSTSIKAPSYLSNLQASAAPQSTPTPDVSKKPLKVKWVLNSSEGSWVPLTSEETLTESCKKEGEQIFDLNGNDADACKG